ncbi:MAG TPA: copper chaperone PCu(A)C [Pseudonocardiaceae bacterium]|jgi:copper(I)-binding protein|nr:copper chaperone PCu(A)C [Pseudonocardiaceae bacterium]
MTEPAEETSKADAGTPRPGRFAGLFIRHDVDGPRWRRPTLAALGVLVIIAAAAITWVATSPDLPPAALTVTKVYVPPTSSNVADVYFTLSNTGAGPDTLTSAGAEYQTGAAAKSVTLCAEDPCSGGSPIDVPATDVILFGPGGPHIEVTGLGPLNTKHQPLQLTLTFSRSGTLHILAPVGSAANLSMNDVMTYGFMGHSSPGMGDMSGMTDMTGTTPPPTTGGRTPTTTKPTTAKPTTTMNMPGMTGMNMPAGQ